jgi:hypothetical protein
MAFTPLSAVDCVSPAITRTKALLFQPFRMRFWLKLAIVAVLSGALVGGCNANFNFNNVGGQHPTSGGSSGSQSVPPGFGKIADALRQHPGMWAAIATGVVAFLLVVFILFVYISSVLRFVLLDALLSGEIHIRAGWHYWKAEGMRLFGWLLLFGLVTTGGTLALIAAPLYAAWRKGILGNLPAHLPEFIAGAAVIFLTIAALALVSFVVGTFIHDFVVPVMRYERAGFLAGWQTAWSRLTIAPGSLAVYYLLKIALLMGAGIAVSIVSFFVFLLLLVPLVLIGLVAVLISGILIAALGGVGLAIVITLGLVFGLLFGFGMAYAQATVTLPVTAFMQYYALFFLGSRYEPLGAQLFPAPPPVPVAPVAAPLVPPVIPPMEPGSGPAPASI